MGGRWVELIDLNVRARKYSIEYGVEDGGVTNLLKDVGGSVACCEGDDILVKDEGGDRHWSMWTSLLLFIKKRGRTKKIAPTSSQILCSDVLREKGLNKHVANVKKKG